MARIKPASFVLAVEHHNCQAIATAQYCRRNTSILTMCSYIKTWGLDLEKQSDCAASNITQNDSS